MRARPWVVLGVVVVAGLILQQFWHWEVERVDVPPGKFLVVTNLWGTDLPEGEILAPDATYKGIQLEVLPEGRHFLNPFFYKSEEYKMVEVPAGQCAVLTRLYGPPIPAERLAKGDFLAGPGERGIVGEVLMPGRHRVNPHAFNVELVPAVEVTTEQVGIRTLKVGKDATALKPGERPGPYLVPEGYRGVQAKTVRSGTYYLNPYVESITPVDVRSHRVEFSDIEFPTKDGYNLRPYVLVTYRVLAEKSPELFVTLTEEGKISQTDMTPTQQEKNQILQKIVLPLIRGYVRIEGSKFDAADFIADRSVAGQAPAANARERLQQELNDKVPPRCLRAGVAIESLTLAQLDAPGELLRQIADREQARVDRERNIQQIETYKTEQELKATEALKAQESAKVAANTRLIQAQTEAKQRLDVEEAKLKQELDNARVKLEAAKNTAKQVLAIGQAEADVINLQNEAEVSGLRRAVQGFPSPEAFAQYSVLAKLAPALGEIFASDTSEFAKLFAMYMTPVNGKLQTVPPVTSTTTAKETIAPPVVPVAPPAGPDQK